jgi:CRISPR-associated protein Cmr4
VIRVLQVITPVHVGEGAAVGAVDLPVARERHTGWPIVPGSALKGAVRVRAGGVAREPARIARTFGSEPGEDPIRGEVSFGDATLLALAVRSLQGTFALLTSPLALARLSRWLPEPPPIPEPGVERVCCADPARLTLPKRDRVVLEDLTLLPEGSDLHPWVERLRTWVGDEAPLEHLALVHDDVFSLAARIWLPIRTRAAIDDDGVVKTGHLFTTETLPPETLLVTTVRGASREHEGLLPEAGELFSLGGQRTIGCGRVAWYGGKA